MGRKIKGQPVVLRTTGTPSERLTRARLFEFLALQLKDRIPVPLTLSSFTGGAGLRDWPARNHFTVGLKAEVWRQMPTYRPCDIHLAITRVVPPHLRGRVDPDLIRNQFWKARHRLLRKQRDDDKFYDILEAETFVINELIAQNPELQFTNMRYEQLTGKHGHVTMVCWYKDIPMDLSFDVPATRDPFSGQKHIR